MFKLVKNGGKQTVSVKALINNANFWGLSGVISAILCTFAGKIKNSI